MFVFGKMAQKRKLGLTQAALSGQFVATRRGETDVSIALRPDMVDLFIIGGGINGCGIARDATGRGLSVTLAEQGDLAQATSSASTKLFHGGLRYLEYFEFRLVRGAGGTRNPADRDAPHQLADAVCVALPPRHAIRI